MAKVLGLFDAATGMLLLLIASYARTTRTTRTTRAGPQAASSSA
jgi:hypothetical protein